MFWIFFSFSPLNFTSLSWFSFSSLFAFSYNLANNALKLYIRELCCWNSLALFAFLFSVAFDFLPQASWSLLSPALLNFNTFYINLTGFEGRDEAGNRDKDRVGSRGKDGADSGNKSRAGNRGKNEAAIAGNSSTGDGRIDVRPLPIRCI